MVSKAGMIRRLKANRISLPFCVVILLAVAVLFRSFSILKQNENESRLREEVQALADEFGVEFSVTLQELVKRGIVSPSLAQNLQSNNPLAVAAAAAPVDDGEDENEGFESEAILEGVRSEHKRVPVVGQGSKFLYPDQWMRPGEKYFVYQSSGGLSNQRIMLESALIVGKLLNRTVIVPQLGPHTSMWYNFNNIAVHDFIPADLLLDGDSIRSLSKVEFLTGNVTFRDFIAENENPETWFRVMRNKLSDKRVFPWDMQYLVNHFAHLDSPVIVFARGTMWECFDFPPEVIDNARRAVRAHPALRRIARDLVTQFFPKGFNSVHIRFMDDDGTYLREGLLKPAPAFIYRMKAYDKSLPLYIATVPRRRYNGYFKPFSGPFKTIVYGDVLENDPKVREFLGQYTRKMQTTVLGLIEQLVCARADMFIGTGFSTFSEHIRRMRRWRELVMVRGLEDAEEREKERKFGQVETLCLNPLVAC